MAAIPDYIISAAVEMIRPFRRAVTAERLRRALDLLPDDAGITCGEAAGLLGVSTRTLQRRARGLRPVRVAGGHGSIGARYYRIEDFRRACGAGNTGTKQEQQ